MTKIVINDSDGGRYGLSVAAIRRLRDLGYAPAYQVYIKGDELGDAWAKMHPNDKEAYMPSVEEFNLYMASHPEIVANIMTVGEDDRANPLLVQVVEELESEANGRFAKLRIAEIPNDVEWEITEYMQGAEYVSEKHRKWYVTPSGYTKELTDE